jgi:hemolysin activation/secretion protein
VPVGCDEPNLRGRALAIIVFALLSSSLDAVVSLGQPASASSALLVKGFAFYGNTAISSDDLEEVTQPYVGQRLDLPGLEQAAEQVADYYRRKGYTLASAYVPQQDIKFGVVTIAILEGRLGDISVSGNRHYSTDFIRGSFADAMEEGVIRNGRSCC